MNKRNQFLGIVLVLAGIFLLMNNLFNFNFFDAERLWPLFVLGLGLIFEAAYFVSRKNPGLLVPGGILTTVGLLFLFEAFTNWHYSAYTWPVYPLAVAVGLMQLYLFSGRPKGLLIPVFILGGVSATSLGIMLFGNFFAWLNMSYAFPLIVIIIGLGIYFKDSLR